MKITFKSLLLTAFAFGSLQGYSQNAEQTRQIIKNYDLNKLEQLRIQFENSFIANKAAAVKMAESKGWPLTIEGKDGTFSELIKVTDENTPIYYSTSNAQSARTSRANRLYPGGTSGLSLTGLGMVAGVWDGRHPRKTHLDLAGRITTIDIDNAIAGHATHVVGTVIGSGANESTAKGMAYEATVKYGNWDLDLSEMTTQASQGLLVSNHSYGYGEAQNLPAYLFGAYVGDSRDLDELLFNAPNYQAVIAAGNDRELGINPAKNGHDLLTGFGTSKNGLIVAATSAVLNYTGPSSVAMSSFSNWGPTDDLRIKPDISDKGVFVISTYSDSDTSYQALQGTSMAAPGVTGVIVLLQQHFKNLNAGTFMPSAMVRGLIAHTASEAGNANGPDSSFGWGLIDAEKSARVISTKGSSSIMDELVLLPGDTYTRQITASGTEPLVATISWTDPAGNAITSQTVDVSTPVLVNDLDLRITRNGDTFLPWKLQSMTSNTAIKGDNSVDNIEKIEVPTAQEGQYTLTVTHKKTTLVNPGGVPSQKYSLIVSGLYSAFGVKDVSVDVFNVWPNPAHDHFNVSIAASGDENSTVEVYDVRGRKMLAQKLTDLSDGLLTGAIDVSAYAPGIYLVKVNQGAKQQVKKIVIK